MGQLTIDHSGYDARPGQRHGRCEYDTAHCGHCEAVICIVRRGCNTFEVSGGDLRELAQHAHEFGSQYTHHRRCRKCQKNLCRDCDQALAATDVCPGSFRDRMRQWAADLTRRFRAHPLDCGGEQKGILA